MDKSTAYMELFKLSSVGNLQADKYITQLASQEHVSEEIVDYLSVNTSDLNELFDVLKSKPLYESMFSESPVIVAKGLSSLITHLIIDKEYSVREGISQVFNVPKILEALQEYLSDESKTDKLFIQASHIGALL